MDDASPPVAWTLQTKCNMNNTKEWQKTQNFLNVAGLLYAAPKFCKVTRTCRSSQRIGSRVNSIFRTSFIFIQDTKWENSYMDFQMRKDLMWKLDIIEQSVETHPVIDQVQQHTQQGCGSTCPPASCWGGWWTFGLSLMLGLVLEPQVWCKQMQTESIQFNKCNHLSPKGPNYSDFKPNPLPGQSNHATLTFLMWLSGQSDILECVLLKRGNLSQKSWLKRVHILTSGFTHKDGRSRHEHQIVWAFSCIWALLLGLAGTERGSRCQLQYKSLWCQSAARCPVWREPFPCSSTYFFRTPPASQFLNGPSSAEFLQCKRPSGIKNMKD